MNLFARHTSRTRRSVTWIGLAAILAVSSLALTQCRTVQDSVTKLERTNIRSPLDGVVINRKLEVGQTVQSSQQIATLFVVAADLSEIEIEG